MLRRIVFFHVGLFIGLVGLLWSGIVAPTPVQAIQGCAQNFAIDPSSAEPGDRVDVYVENIQLQDSDVVLIDINGQRSFTCDGDCGGYLMEYRVPGTAVAGESISFFIVHIDGAGDRCETTKYVTVTTPENPVCQPVGMQGVSPTAGGTGDTFVFAGCLGGYDASKNPGLLIREQSAAGGAGSIELPISAGSVDAEGRFQVSRSGFQPGVWSAQLYLTQAPQGSGVQFSIEGVASTCTEAVVCQGSGGQPGTKECTGLRPPGGACNYDSDGCTECRYCGDNQCNNNETAASCAADCSTAECGNGRCESGETPNSCAQDCDPEDVDQPELDDFNFCAQVPADQQGDCIQCMGANAGTNEDAEKLYTAVGCIQLSNQGLVADLVKLLLGVAGGVALLTILTSSFLIATSQGEPSRVKQARELMTAAVSGLFFMIFSVILLQFVGVEILQIPGLG